MYKGGRIFPHRGVPESPHSLIFSAENPTQICLILYSPTSQGVPFTLIYSAQLATTKLLRENLCYS